MDPKLDNLHRDGGLGSRQAERFLVNRPGRVMAIGLGLAQMKTFQCQILDISRLGAGLSMVSTIGLPDHYYLNVVGTAERIGCAEVYRNGARIGVKFIKPLDDSYISYIIRGDFFAR